MRQVYDTHDPKNQGQADCEHEVEKAKLKSVQDLYEGRNEQLIHLRPLAGCDDGRPLLSKEWPIFV
jgi:hypothetical protein